jgi:hypothetical protein
LKVLIDVHKEKPQFLQKIGKNAKNNTAFSIKHLDKTKKDARMLRV